MPVENVYDENEKPSRLPHFLNIREAQEAHEPLYKNLFEIRITLPDNLVAKGYDTLLLLRNAKNFPLTAMNPTLETAIQNYKFSSRIYVNPPQAAQTSIPEFTINFNINENPDNKTIPVYNTLRAWYDLQWDSQSGKMNYKRDCMGTITVNHHDKPGNVIRRLIFHNVQLKGLSGYELSWAESNIVDDFNANFCCDYWEDLVVNTDGNYSANGEVQFI